MAYFGFRIEQQFATSHGVFDSSTGGSISCLVRGLNLGGDDLEGRTLPVVFRAAVLSIEGWSVAARGGGMYIAHTKFPLRAVRSEPPGGALVFERSPRRGSMLAGLRDHRSARIGSQECE